MTNVMFFASFEDAHGKEQASLYFDYPSFFRDTFSPKCKIIQMIDFKVIGKNYTERKENLRDIAIDYSCNQIGGLSYGELYRIQNFFEKNGRRYGLLEEFRENGIC